MKVLLISYNFPPFIRAASLRTFTWFRDFDEKIQITVLTRKWDSNKTYDKDSYYHEDEGQVTIEEYLESKRIIYVPNKHNTFQRIKYSKVISKLKLRKIFTFIELISKWSKFSKIEPEYSLFKKANSILKDEKFDVIIASGEPFVTFKYAYLLAKKSNAEYVLDYRDGWSTNFFVNSLGGTVSKFLLKHQKRYEIKFIKNAAMVTFVSDHLKQQVLGDLKLGAINTQIIPNGVDLLPFKSTIKNSLNNQFTITFVGTLYPEHKLDYLLDAVHEIVENDNQKNIKLKFIGSLIICPPRFKLIFNQFEQSHPNRIEFIDHLPNEEAINEQLNATMLLKFNAFEQLKNHFGKKLYEYAASGKQVISINSQPHFKNDNCFFNEQPFQFFCNNKEDVKELINLKYDEWEAGIKLSNRINIDELYPFSTQYYTGILEQEILSLKSNSL